MNRLSFNAVTRRYPGRGSAGTVDALGPVDLVVEDGAFVALIGPSGCGKSTLLRLAAGLDAPSAGEVLLNGRRVVGPASECGMVFQRPALFPWLTVRDNIGFGLAQATDDRAARDAIVARQLTAVGLDGFADHYPMALSGGMRQRAAIARALAPAPEVLLLDEPFGALDQQTRAMMQEMLEGLWRTERRTVLLVTHDIEEALFLADRVLVMSARPGRILDSLAVEFTRPRDPDIRTTAPFMALKAAISAPLRAEVLASLDHGGAPREP